MTHIDWLTRIILVLLEKPGVLIGLAVVLLPVYYHRSLVRAEARHVIEALKEGSELRSMLVKVKNTLLTRLLLESNKMYHQLYGRWLSVSGRRGEVVQQIAESMRDPDKFLNKISSLLKERVYEDEFTRLLEDGKIHIEEEMVEAIKKLYNGIRVVDGLFEAYTHALHLKSKYEYWMIPLLVFIVVSFFVASLAPGGGYEAIAIAVIIASAYYGYYSQHERYVKEAKKHIFEIKAKTDIGEVLRYVARRAE